MLLPAIQLPNNRQSDSQYSNQNLDSVEGLKMTTLQPALAAKQTRARVISGNLAVPVQFLEDDTIAEKKPQNTIYDPQVAWSRITQPSGSRTGGRHVGAHGRVSPYPDIARPYVCSGYYGCGKLFQDRSKFLYVTLL